MSKRSPETTNEWLEYWDAKRQKAFDNYQSTGEPKYDREHYKYDVICDALAAKLRDEGERNDALHRRLTNCAGRKARLDKNKTYDYLDVCELLDEAVWW